MSAAVCRSLAAATGFESILALPAAAAAASTLRSTWAEQQQQQQKPNPTLEEDEYVKNDAEEKSERPPGQFDIWTSIQAQKAASAQQQQQPKDEPYVHPLVRRSSSLLSQKSLEICTESLGSETGSDDFFSSDDETTIDFFSLIPKKEEEPSQQQQQQQQQEEQDDNEDCEDDDQEFEHASNGKRELVTVNYHCSISRRSSLPRSFPPPLPSISRRDGPCLQMRTHRRDGRLVVEAVPVPSQNYLHAERQNGRLLLSFINTTSSSSSCRNGDNGVVDSIEQNKQVEATQDEEAAMMMMMEEAEADEDQDETEVEEEEEVEVVDRGTVVEVKVSTQPQQSSSGGAAATKKVHRSSIVINKFVSCTSAIVGSNKLQEIANIAAPPPAETTATTRRPSVSPMRRLSTATTTAAAAAVAASSLSALSATDGSHSSTNDNKLLFTSRRRNREELLHDMRRCSQLRKPLFIWEPCCIATSS